MKKKTHPICQFFICCFIIINLLSFYCFFFIYYSISEQATKNKDNQHQKIVPHIPGQLNNDLYAIPVKKKIQASSDDIEIFSPDKENTDDTDLPPGWEKHEGMIILSIYYFSEEILHKLFDNLLNVYLVLILHIF